MFGAIGQVSVEVDGKVSRAIGINGTVPGPLIRLKEGQRVRLRVQNTLDEDSSIHWHGLLVPFQMDGVPGVSFPGIKVGQTFVYEFPVKQSGTYWYHSHSGLQEQSGHYGPLIIDPAESEPVEYERDYILLLSDFTVLDPHFIMSRLRTGEGYFNRQLSSWTDNYPMSGEERRMWAEMRMPATDIMDIGAPTYTFLANGQWRDERGVNLLDTGAHFYDTYACADGKYISIGSIEPQFYALLLEKTGLKDEPLPAQMDRKAWTQLNS